MSVHRIYIDAQNIAMRALSYHARVVDGQKALGGEEGEWWGEISVPLEHEESQKKRVYILQYFPAPIETLTGYQNVNMNLTYQLQTFSRHLSPSIAAPRGDASGNTRVMPPAAASFKNPPL